jgi:hypothetical protein
MLPVPGTGIQGTCPVIIDSYIVTGPECRTGAGTGINKNLAMIYKILNWCLKMLPVLGAGIQGKWLVIIKFYIITSPFLVMENQHRSYKVHCYKIIRYRYGNWFGDHNIFHGSYESLLGPIVWYRYRFRDGIEKFWQ